MDTILQEIKNFTDFNDLRAMVKWLLPCSPLDSTMQVELSDARKEALRAEIFKLDALQPDKLEDKRGFRAHIAVLLGAIGKAEDAKTLEEWIEQEWRAREKEDADCRAKISAWESGGRKTGFPGGIAQTVHWSWYQGALIQLGCPEAAEVFVRFLSLPEFFGDAAWGLVHLADTEGRESCFDFNQRSAYAEIYKRQESLAQLGHF